MLEPPKAAEFIRNRAALSFANYTSLLSLDDEDALDRPPAVKIEMHTRTRSDQMRIDCSAIFVDVANLPAKHIRYRLSVGRGLHDDRRRRRNGCLWGRECGHRPNCNRSGGHLRGRRLRRGRLSGLGGPWLRKRQRHNHCTSKSNSCSSHVSSFVELTFPGCFGTRVPFGCLDQPCSRTSDSDTEESALRGHAAPRASSTRSKIS
jgi:hypothetical protein